MLQKNITNASNPSRNAFNSYSTIGNASSTLKCDDASNDTLLNLIDEMALDPPTLVVKMNAMSILYHHLFGNIDQKLFSAVIEINTKVSFTKLSILRVQIYRK